MRISLKGRTCVSGAQGLGSNPRFSEFKVFKRLNKVYILLYKTTTVEELKLIIDFILKNIFVKRKYSKIDIIEIKNNE